MSSAITPPMRKNANDVTEVELADHLVVGGGDDLDDLLAQGVAAVTVRWTWAAACGRGHSPPPLWSLPRARPGCRTSEPPSGRCRCCPASCEVLRGGACELVGADDLDVEEHPRVVDTAQLGAAAHERALRVGVKLKWLSRPGDHVHLEQERRDPERVDDVGRGQLEPRRSRRPGGTASAGRPWCRRRRPSSTRRAPRPCRS